MTRLTPLRPPTAGILAACIVFACHRPPAPPAPPPAECPPTRPAGSRDVDAAALARLPGAYTLVTVSTARGYGGGWSRAALTLAANDTLARYYMTTPGGAPEKRGDRPYAGRVTLAGRRTDTVIVVGAAFRVGCQFWMCMDASPTRDVIVAVTHPRRARWALVGAALLVGGAAFWLARRGRP